MPQEQPQFGLIISESGQQIPFSAPAGITVGSFAPNDPTTQTVRLDIDEAEFASLREQAKTNSIPDDTIKAKEVTN